MNTASTRVGVASTALVRCLLAILLVGLAASSWALAGEVAAGGDGGQAPASAPTPPPVPEPAPPSAGTPPSLPPSAPVPPPIPPPPPVPAAGPGDTAVTLGLELLKQGSINGAGEQFEKALALDPNNAVAHARLAYVRFRKANYAGAAAGAQEALRLDPNDTLAMLIVGRSKEALGDAEAAKASYSAAAALLDKAETQERLVSSALGYYLKAMQQIQKNEWGSVEADLKEVVRVYPQNVYAQYEYALAVLHAGRAQEALDMLKAVEPSAGSFHPAETWVYPNRRYTFFSENVRFWEGVALRTAGRHDEAIAQFEGLLPRVESFSGATSVPERSQAQTVLEGTVEKSFFGAYYEEALALQTKGDKDRALDLLKRFGRLRLPDPDLQQKVKDLQKTLK